MLQLSTAQLRECGLSGQKTAYIQDIAQRFSSGEFTTARIVGGRPLLLVWTSWRPLQNACPDRHSKGQQCLRINACFDALITKCMVTIFTTSIFLCMLAAMDDEELYRELCAVKGIGEHYIT